MNICKKCNDQQNTNLKFNKIKSFSFIKKYDKSLKTG